MPAPRKYEAETQERAVRMYRDRIAEHGGSKTAARRMSASCSISRRRHCGTGSRRPTGRTRRWG